MTPVRWGVLGTASINEAVLPALSSVPDAELVAIASRDLARARASAERFGAARAFGDYDALLTSGSVDAVYIPLPNALHAQWTVRALESGLTVLCEKPIALNAVEAERVAAASMSAGRAVIEGFMYRYHPQIDRAAELVASGAIGTLRAMHGVFSFRLDTDGTVVDDGSLGGGALMDVGCYPVHAMRRFAGGEPIRVFAERTPESGVDRTLLGTLTFPNGLLGTLETSIDADEEHRFELIGSHGRLILRDPWVAVDREATVEVVRDRVVVERVTVPACNPYALQVADACRAARGEALRWGVEDAVSNMRVLDALAESGRSREVRHLR